MFVADFSFYSSSCPPNRPHRRRPPTNLILGNSPGPLKFSRKERKSYKVFLFIFVVNSHYLSDHSAPDYPQGDN